MIALVSLVDQHHVELEYDWRTRFQLPLRSVFDGTLTWRESCALLKGLLTDPTSRIAAKVSGLDHPWSREAAILADVWDLLAAVNADPKKSPPTYPRPVPKRLQGKHSQRPTVSKDIIRRALEARGHKLRGSDG